MTSWAIWMSRGEVIHSDFGRTISRHGGVHPYRMPGWPTSMDNAECNAMRDSCLRSDPIVISLVHEIEKCYGQPLPVDRIICLPCLGRPPRDGEGGGASGRYIPPWDLVPGSPHHPFGMIALCYDIDPDGVRDCRTLRHELQHLLQYCRARTNRPWWEWPDPVVRTPDMCITWEIESYCSEDPSSPCCNVWKGSPIDVTWCCSAACSSCHPLFPDSAKSTSVMCQTRCRAKYGRPPLPTFSLVSASCLAND